MTVESILFQASVWILPVLLAITLHEAAHGWMAHRLGDDTAYRLGRVTFNPFRHIDPLGTVVLPAALLFLSGGRMMFGYAKPVPVAFQRLRQPRRDMVLVALAGPGSNVLMATAAALALHLTDLAPELLREWLAFNFENAIWFNILLAVFNMLPIPPLDGGRVAVGLLPWSLAAPLARLEKAGFAIIVGAVFILPYLGSKLGYDLNVFRWLVLIPTQTISNFFFRLAGM